MRKLKIVSLFVAVLLALSLTACCTITVEVPFDLVSGFFRSNPAPAVPAESNQTAAPDTTAPVEPPVETGMTQEPSTAAPVENTTAAPVETTTAAPVETTTAAPVENTTAAPSGAPATKEEIITYYVTAYNKIASEAKSIVRTYDYTSQYNNILDINGNATLAKLAQTLMTQFMKEDKSELPGDASSLPPVGLTSLSIAPGQISNATCEDKGDYYEVKLYSTGTDDNWEIDSQPGTGSAGVIGPLLRTEDVSGAAGSLIKFEGLHSWYGTACVTANIDKATGHITYFDFLTPSVLHFDSVTAALVVKVSNCNIGLLFHQQWKIGY